MKFKKCIFLYFLIRSFKVYTYTNNNDLVFLLLNVLLKILLIIWNIVYEIKIIIKQVLNKRAILQKYTWSKNFVIFLRCAQDLAFILCYETLRLRCLSKNVTNKIYTIYTSCTIINIGSRVAKASIGRD